MENKDPRNSHFWWSMIKSVIRIGGYGLLLISIPWAVIVLIVSEAIGIIEEL